MEVVDVIRKLIGQVEPIGSSHIDEDRYKNLIVLCEVVDELLGDISSVRQNKNRVEYSMNRSGKYADEWLNDRGMKE